MLVIFDWDGTLLDSLAKITQCMQLAAADVGLDPREEQAIRGIVGPGLQEALEELYPGLKQAPLDELRARYSHHFVVKDVQPCDTFPGVHETLDQLKSDGHQIAVATGKSRRGLNRVLGNLGWEQHFHASRCADETASKPNPLMLEELLTEMNCGLDEAVMVGDTEFDMEMAARLGMRRIAVSYGAHSPERLARQQPEAIIDSMPTLLDLLNN